MRVQLDPGFPCRIAENAVGAPVLDLLPLQRAEQQFTRQVLPEARHVGVQGLGGGYALVTIDLDSGGSVIVSMPLESAPARGVRGVVSYEGGEPAFRCDAG